MRGEDCSKIELADKAFGSPPHARGRRHTHAEQRPQERITPACAGKTPPRLAKPALADHPRMRGEDRPRTRLGREIDGSPPHARGRLIGGMVSLFSGRITPACAGKTSKTSSAGSKTSDHPRMRGEDGFVCRFHGFALGSPPHARGRRQRRALGRAAARITPACAGKTEPATVRLQSMGDHPRMRGEDGDQLNQNRHQLGSPPHARGRPPTVRRNAGPSRITPACAGKTLRGANRDDNESDHPRMRGEDQSRMKLPSYARGSPPHARGRREPVLSLGVALRITPACAGKTLKTLKV